MGVLIQKDLCRIHHKPDARQRPHTAQRACRYFSRGSIALKPECSN
jgi:hypothetical protein